jgi:replicative DNA helicase
MENSAEYKLPPHSIEAEQSVIGGLLLDDRAYSRIADRISVNDFYRRDHQIIFEAIVALKNDNAAADFVTVCDWLKARNKLEVVGGYAYVGGLAKNTPSAANIVTYADIVRERSVLRQLVRVGTDIANNALESDGRETQDLLAEAESLIFGIRQQNAGSDGLKPVSLGVENLIDNLEAMMENGGFTGISTGFDEIDKMTNGLQNGDLIIVAGRPSMGKTSFAMNIAEHVAVCQGKKVAVFSLEQPTAQITMRLITSMSGFEFGRNFDSDRIPLMSSAATKLKSAQIFIDDTGGLSPNKLKARAKLMAIQNGVDLIIVDYLQLMNGRNKSNHTRNDEVSDISRELKSLAKELNVPVIALSQLNRGVEQRPNKRPNNSDLRDSGAIEQDADVIMFIYRDEVYNSDSQDKGTAEVIISKQRNGPCGMARLAFIGNRFRFENLGGSGYERQTSR